MPDTGWVVGSTATTEGPVSPTWQNSSLVTARDSSKAYIQNGGSGKTVRSIGTTSFGFNIPTNSIIDGLEMRVRCNQVDNGGGATVYIDEMYFEKADGTEGSKTSNTNITGSLTDYSRGGSSDLWGLTLSPADVNSASFKAYVAFYVQTNMEAQVDSVEAKVHYTPVPKQNRGYIFG